MIQYIDIRIRFSSVKSFMQTYFPRKLIKFTIHWKAN